MVPQVEVWGFSRTLGRLGEAAQIAMETGHPRACILPDVFHLFKGGSPLEGIRLLAPAAIHVFHLNDYPGQPARNKLTDADRIYPGDGIAPYNTLLRDLRAGGFRVMLSLEVFNRDYWRQDPLSVARTGLEKMKCLCKPAWGDSFGLGSRGDGRPVQRERHVDTIATGDVASWPLPETISLGESFVCFRNPLETRPM